MIQALNKLKITRTQRQLFRAVGSVVLAVSILLLMQADLLPFAVLLAVMSKWQIVLGGPRLWLHNIRDNAVDIVVLWSFLALLVAYSPDPALQWAMVAMYLLWQLLVKPMEGVSGRGAQALFALGIGVGTLFLFKGIVGTAGLILASWLVALIVADHFLEHGENESNRWLVASVWSLIVAQHVWIFAHWLVLYPFLDGRLLIPQPALVLVAVGYAFGNIYYDHSQKRLSKKRLYGYLGFISLVILGLVIGSEWITQL